MNIEGVNPETDNEFKFYEFVRTTTNNLLEPWIKKARAVGYKIRPIYERAINQKLTTNTFINPHKFPEYFENQFDYIAIDFETGNNSRLSACAIGLSFVKDNKSVHSFKHFIKPPSSEKFLNTHTNIHGITKDDVEFALNFKELWDIEFSKYFFNNLIVFHNASMDLSILKNLFEHYDISPYQISYIDTMLFADKLGYSKISQNLFWQVYSKIEGKYEKVYFGELNHEYACETNRNFDFVIKDIKKVIEFNGEQFHVNPNLTEEEKNVGNKSIQIKQPLKQKVMIIIKI